MICSRILREWKADPLWTMWKYLYRFSAIWWHLQCTMIVFWLALPLNMVRNLFRWLHTNWCTDLHNDKLTKLYREYISQHAFLSEKHRRLIDDMNSGDEEEFVMAAEYYLTLRMNWSTREQLSEHAKQQYGGCCPVSVLIFALLSKEMVVPCDYNHWLITVFQQNRLPHNDIEDDIASL